MHPFTRQKANAYCPNECATVGGGRATWMQFTERAVGLLPSVVVQFAEYSRLLSVVSSPSVLDPALGEGLVR
jgi:hypothetical protein